MFNVTVLIIGNEGNMGRRYTAICRHLGHTVLGIDFPYLEKSLEECVHVSDYIIIATPTITHHQVLYRLGMIGAGGPILCEKPIVTSIDEMDDIRRECRKFNLKAFCVNQYAYMPAIHTKGAASRYSYFNSGKDGLLWDCFQIFGLATGTIHLDNRSPTWLCKLNGWELDISDMDLAYVDMIEDFLGSQNKLWDMNMAWLITKKIVDYENSTDWHTSA